ncbi:MAG: DUF2442 domain-containing protein [Gemmatimonadaceae bacterium]
MAITKRRRQTNVVARDSILAKARGAATRRAGLLGKSVRYDVTARRLMIELINGVLFGVPIDALREIRSADDTELKRVELLGAGGILHWESLDADYSVPALILDAVGKTAAQSANAQVGGQATSAAKAAAARANGRKGGRPRMS